MTMDAEIYGITPSAKIEALPNAPPENILSKPTRPSLVELWRLARVNAREDYETTHSVDQKEKHRIDESLAEFLNLEDVFDCLDKFHDNSITQLPLPYRRRPQSWR